MAQRMRTYTEYDAAHMVELQRVISQYIAAKATQRSRISNLLWGVVGLTAAVLIAIQGQHWIIASVFGALSLLLICRGVFFYQFAALSARLTMNKQVERSDYLLEKSYILMTNSQGSQQYAYGDCFQLLETAGNFYFIQKDGQGLVLDKGNLKGGTADELRSWLEERCGRKAQWAGRKRG